jgi:hypothetical protein
MPMLVLYGDQPSRRCDWSGHGLRRSRSALACDYQAALVCAPSITGGWAVVTRINWPRGEGSSPPGGRVEVTVAPGESCGLDACWQMALAVGSRALLHRAERRGAQRGWARGSGGCRGPGL